jgi:acetylornithine deacetylase
MSDAQMPETIPILEKLVRFSTVSDRSNLDLVDWIVDLLAPWGARIRLTHDDARCKANIVASFGPDVAGGVVLSAHTDVVPVEGQDWSSDPFVLTRRDDRLHGRGTADMKGFVACCLAAAPSFAAARLKRPIHLAFSYDEEVGCLGVGRLIADLLAHAGRPGLAIVGEPTRMRIGASHRGCHGFRTRFHGQAAHSSDPAAGTSAIYPAAEFVSYLKAIALENSVAGTGTTFNVGRIDGGSAINIVPAVCDIIWEFRTPGGFDTAALEAEIRSVLAGMTRQGVRCETEGLIQVAALSPSTQAIERVRAFGAIEPVEHLLFGTEAGFFQAAGVPVVVCGPGSIDQAHRPNEWIDVDQLLACDRFLARVVDWAATTSPDVV